MAASVDEIINDARSYSVDVLTAAGSALAAAMNTLMTLRGVGVQDVIVPPPDPPIPLPIGDPPAYNGTRFERQGDLPDAPDLASLRDISLPNEPLEPQNVDLTFHEPPEPPEHADASLLAGVPDLPESFDVPTPADYEAMLAALSKPVITPIVVPDAPEWMEPEFLGVQPSPMPAPPTDLADQQRSAYLEASDMMRAAVAAEIDAFIDREFPQHRVNLAAIEAKLAQYLAGGTAVNPEIEDQIYFRALDKTDEDARKAAAAAVKRAAQMGHVLVSPTIYGELATIDGERRKANARVASDIAVKTFELEQQNMQFAVTTSITLRKVAIDAGLAYYNGLITLNGHALQYATSLIDAIVKCYELAAKYAEIQIRMYEAEADIYKARLQASLAIFEVYKARLQALEAQASIDKAMVDLYRAEIDAVTAQIGAYKAQIDGLEARVNIETQKVNLYRARVGAYGEMVNADVARWRGYEALVHGRTAKIQAGSEQYRAYGIRVNAYEATIRGRIAELEGSVRINESLVRAYSAEVEAFAAGNRAESEAVQAEIASYKATVDAYTAKAHASSELSRAYIARYEVLLRAIVEQARLLSEHLRGVNQVEAAKAAAISQIAVAGGEVYGRTAQAAVSGMNTLAAQVTSS